MFLVKCKRGKVESLKNTGIRILSHNTSTPSKFNCRLSNDFVLISFKVDPSDSYTIELRVSPKSDSCIKKIRGS